MTFAVRNKTNGIELASSVALAGTSVDRRRGLLEFRELADGAGLWITPCEAIHTFGMGMSIDAIFIDRNRRVKKIYSALRPRRLGWCFTADSVVELSEGVAARSKTRVGDLLEFVRQGVA